MKEIIYVKNRSGNFFYYPMIFCIFIDIVLIIGLCFFEEIFSISIAISMFWSIFIITFLLYLGPLLIVFFNHWYYSRNTGISMEVIDDEIIFTFKFAKRSVMLEYKNVSRIELMLSYPRYDGRVSWMFWDNYYYFIIVMKDGKSYPVSCLICGDLLKYISREKITNTRIMFPIIFGVNLIKD
ncbi:hypothetical protein SAMN04488007_0826 [Maribacter aquivivus]|uniref:PH domain-containing protein n=2 Tax=Maribacter aquivivus TaxID=228958 RepID=A0A1M6KL09_9FLAO|nr:hypothetical protein SAMN04488007_0826 [Maribacter aquivivus]